MAEATFVNIVTVLRVLFLGGVLWIMPHITRKGLLFGVYVGEELSEHEAARGLISRWRLGCAVLVVVSLVFGFALSLSGHPVAGNYLSAAIMVLGGLGLYVVIYSRAKALVPASAARQAGLAVAPIGEVSPHGSAFSILVLGICLLVSVGAFLFAVAKIDVAPTGTSEGPTTPVNAFMLLPVLNLILSPFLALLAVLTTKAKLSLRGGSGGGSADVQVAFRATLANLISWIALLACGMLATLSVQLIRLELGEVDSLGIGTWILVGASLLFMLISQIRLFTKYGQGGALVEEGSAQAPLTNGLADNTHWHWGVFYVDRDDPSIMVEKRFGFGYAFNFGNWRAIAILSLPWLLALGSIAFLLSR